MKRKRGEKANKNDNNKGKKKEENIKVEPKLFGVISKKFNLNKDEEKIDSGIFRSTG
jgi:hypothetical protein